MRRDRRLLIAMLLFAGSFTAWAVQVWITALYIDASIWGDWTWFAEAFSVEAPARGPNDYCFGRCAPNLPFVAGWIGIGAFLAGSIMLVNAWWKPRSTDRP
jgi:hypothetical protein